MDSHLRRLAFRQDDLVSSWQLRHAGWSWGKIDHHVRRGGWRRLHRGVFLLTSSPPTRRQLWFAATLTSPDSFLSHGSGGACYGFYRFQRGYEVVTRPGRGGRRRHGDLLAFRSTTLQHEFTRHHGIPITTAARVLVDLAPGLDRKRLGRAFRESIRLNCTSARRVRDSLHRHPFAPGTRVLRELASRYAHIPYHRTRSDAEGLALEVLHDAGIELPRVNTRIGGEEADLAWPHGLLIEIDGPQFHRFPDEDARKVEAWRRANYTVRRISSDDVYDHPAKLLALYRS
jgi:very-short-patch-repair endonuclease